MAKRVGTHEAKTRLSEYLNQVAYRGERVVVERHGKPVAALVSIEDLRRLDELDQIRNTTEDSEEAREAQFRRNMEDAGLITQWPTGEPVPLSERKRIKVEGQPLSEQLIADRR